MLAKFTNKLDDFLNKHQLFPPFLDDIKETEESEPTFSLAKSDDYTNFLAEEIINETLKEFFKTVNEEFFNKV